MEFEEFAEKAVKFASKLGCQYCDVRAESITKKGILIENGEIEYLISKEDKGLGIRILCDGVWGFYSISNPSSLKILENAIIEATKTARHFSDKRKTRVHLANIRAYEDKINYPIIDEPNLDELVKIGFDCDKILQAKKRITRAVTSLSYATTSKYFVSSEGSKIFQNYTDVVANLTAIAHEAGLTQSVNQTEGGRGGLEKITKECNILETASFVSEKASELIDAKPAKESKSQVVLNPDFVALLTHEILGHPSEADRVLGKEMAWAGGAWWAGKIGEEIGSSKLNVFDDPSMEGSLGWYQYDDEGIKSSRTNLVENGLLTHHLQNRETAEIFGASPSSNMRATSYKFMPLIRMACTCIDKGDYDPQEMIKEVKQGYLISNMKIPSIDMKRYNWSISCQFAHKIENGEITDLLRDVIVLGTAPDFFKSIDACGNDFQVRPITNCGKGDPMQSMIMGNGGPSVRGVATVKSVE